jgi:tetratricopeptide (TPR) repeat protein
MRDERRGDAAGCRVTDLDAREGSPGTLSALARRGVVRRPSGATRSFPRQMLCLVLSASVGLAACAGPRARPAIPAAVSESDRTACAEFAHERTEQLRLEAKKARASRPTARGPDLTANDVGWILFGIAALPVLVPAFVAALPFGSWKAFRDPNPDPWQLVQERLLSLCTEPAVLATTVGPRHLDTARALVALADEYRQADRIESALDRYRQALTIQEEALGPEHPLIAVTLAGYARALSKAGRASEAATMEDRARRIRAQAEANSAPDQSPAASSPATSED